MPFSELSKIRLAQRCTHDPAVVDLKTQTHANQDTQWQGFSGRKNLVDSTRLVY